MALRAVVAGGGTAGHIEPALAVAEALETQGAEVIALGTKKGLETSIVPVRGFELKLIDPVPFPRKLNLDVVKLPFRLVRSVWQARKILKEFDADVLIGFGGYVSASAYLAAKSAGVPIFVHEANARAGMANKLGVALGGTGLNAVKDSGLKGDVVGIPIRQSFSEGREAAKQRGMELFSLDPAKKTVLVTGGSQGAASLNRAVAESIDSLLAQGYQVIHAYGKKNDRPAARDNYVAVPYIEDMPAAYAVADLIICRAGAMTVAEVTASGLPAVYVPLPHGNGEQGLNAASLVEIGAAKVIADGEFDGDRLITEVQEILGDEGTHAHMRAALSAAGFDDAATNIAQRIVDTVQ